MRDFSAQITSCHTRDLSATAGFYEEIMGVPLTLDRGTCRIYRVAQRAYLGFCQRTDAGRPDGVILTPVTGDVDGGHRRPTALGVPCEKAPAFNPTYQIFQAFLRDPNGYPIEIQRFENPRWNPEAAP